MKKWQSKARLALLYALPVVVFFTNFPLIRLGENSSMYFEISLPMIWLAVFDLLALAQVREMFGFCKKYPKTSLPILAALAYLALSCIWSANPLRGFLTAGILWAIAFAALNFVTIQPRATEKRRLLKILIASSSAVSLFCLLQGFLDVFGIQDNLLCLGCHYQTIGFPHSNGFAIEPQFMGNLLIAPSLISLDILYKKPRRKTGKRYFPILGLSFLQILALFVTFSRGAIFAFILGVCIITIYRALQKFRLRSFCYLFVSAFAFLCGLVLQGVWAEFSPTNEGFLEGIGRSVNHLSLGVVDFSKPESETPATPVEPETGDATTTTESDFTGYIAESTTIRLSLNEVALKTWQQSPKTVVLGVGLGGAGRAISQFLGHEREIVQNEYLSLLLEVGLVGCTLILFAGYVIFRFIGRRLPVVIFAIIFAYLFTLLFFSGITNVWHIYLLTPLLALILAH